MPSSNLLRIGPGLVGLLLTGAATPLLASGQVTVGLEFWSIASSAGTSEFEFAVTPGVPVSLRPIGSGGPAALRVEVGGRGTRAAVAVGLGGADVESRSGGLRITSSVDLLTLVVVSTEVSTSLATFGDRARLRIHGGSVMERWGEATGSRTRIGGLAGLRLEVDLSRKLRFSLGRALAGIGSPVLLRDAAGTDAVGFRPKTMLQSITITGLAYRFGRTASKRRRKARL